MNKVFAIYPLDYSSSNRFLNRINTFETREIKDFWHCYKVHFSDDDHTKCLIKSKESHFIFFMGHGKESKLNGSCAKNGEMSVDTANIGENEDFYDNETFIDSNNISEFKDKILFCFSCNSNRNNPKSLARIAIQQGVQTFVGFGDIPTDYRDNYNFSKRSIAIYKGIITKIIKYAIYYSVINNDTIDTLVRTIRLLTTKEIQKISKKQFHNSDTIVNQLIKFKNDICIYGNRYSKIL